MARSSEHTDFDGFIAQPVPRRTVLKALGILTMGAAADNVVGQVEYGGTRPSIETLTDSEVARRHPNTWCMTIGGFGVYDTQALAQATRPALREYGQPAYLKNANTALQITDIKREALDFARAHDAQRVYVYGQSMGGMEAIEVATHLQSHGVDIPGIWLDCSPLDRTDVKDASRQGVDVLQALDTYQLSGGPLMRSAIQFIQEVGQGSKDYWKICNSALHSMAPENCSTALLASEATYISQFDISRFADKLPGTQFVKLQPDNLDNDPVVRNDTSLARLRGAYPNNPVYEQPVIGGGHANPFDRPHAYDVAILSAGEACAFDDGRDHRLAYALHEMNAEAPAAEPTDPHL